MQKKQEPSVNQQPIPEAKVDPIFPIVGIGASAGGLDPIRKMLEDLPVDTGMAFVVIQHLAAGQESMLPEILSRSTEMKVLQVKDGMKVEKNQVYVITPGTTMTLQNGCLKLVPKGIALKPINDFLISLASERKAQAIGIVLSGTGNDGTEGLKAVKAEGGITLVQDPDTAQYSDMPRNAIIAETAYFILSPEKIVKELVRIAKNPQLTFVEPVTPKPTKGETDQRKILMMLKTAFGVDFSHYKGTTINRRLARRMVINKVENDKEYLTFLRTHPDELNALFDDLLIGVTSFFREPKTFEVLAEKVFPELVKNRAPNESIRVWVPGCSTGEEVYSLAIAIQQFLHENALVDIRVQIFGTDANEKNIEKARQGVYLKTIEDNVSESRLKRFFTRSNGNYQITKLIRDMCIFAKQDITSDPPFSNLDIIMCRNVLIYFDLLLHERVFPIFHYGLKDNRFLVIGESESIGKFGYLFEPITTKGLIFRKKRAQPQAFLRPDTFVPYSAAKKAGKQLEKPNSMNLLKEEVDRLLVAEYVPATLLINNNLEILVFRGQVNPYLIHESGTASFNVAKIVRKELRTDVQTAIYRARKENKTLKEKVQFKAEGQQKAVTIKVKPLKTADYEEPFFLVTFEEATVPSDQIAESMEGSAEKEAVKSKQVRELKEDLESTKQSLQTIIEVQEATNEELRSTMEEAQSSNEELQSTNEELETAKEELQSSNEELQTLNEELKNRNLALGRLNDDLTNLQVNIDLPVIIVDNDLKIRRFTTSAHELLKVSPSDVGQSIVNIKLGVIISDLEEIIAEVTTKLTVFIREVEGVGGHWYELRVRPYLTEDKKIDGAVLTFSDITARKIAEEEMLKSKLILDNSYDSIIVTNLDGKIISWNKGASEIFGYNAEEMHGESIIKVVKPQEKDKIAPGQLQTIRKGDVYSSEWEGVRKDGSPVWLILTTMLLKNSRNEPTGMVGFGKDITERKNTEEKLEEYKKNLEKLVLERTKKLELASLYARNLIEASLDPLVTINAEGKITDVNQATELATGCLREELVGSHFSDYFTEPKKAEEGYKHVFTKGFIRDYPLAIKHKSGKTADVLYNATVYRNQAGEIQGVFAAARDITERNKAEEAARESAKRLKDSERLAAIGATAGMVGHDIRNPLQAITGDIFLAKSDLDSVPACEGKESIKESLDSIDKNVAYINKIVQDLQDFARPVSPNVQETDLEGVCQELLLKNGIPKNITTSCQVAKEVKKVHTDPALLKRVLSNLFNNAVQAMPQGGKIEFAAYKEAGDLVITVQDTGVGIPEEIRSKLFTPLFTTKSKGQGFGLAVIKRVTEALGGTVTLESEVGKGTKFTIRLPPPQSNKR